MLEFMNNHPLLLGFISGCVIGGSLAVVCFGLLVAYRDTQCNCNVKEKDSESKRIN
jgi:hypothetical protein